MEGEAEALVTVMIWLVVSMAYARLASATLEAGKLRLLALLPVVILLPFLPWHFSTVYLRSISGFFLVWIATFRILLLSFGSGPLSPSLPLTAFIAISSLPVKLRNAKKPKAYAKFLTYFALNLLLFTLPMRLYRYKNQIHPHLLLAVFFLHILITFPLLFSFASFLGALLDLDLEPQFDNPFKSTSLQEFWGRRWNLAVSGILRQSVYAPVSSYFGRNAGFFATFLVSGLMHEVMYYYHTLEEPTGEKFCFFVLQAICALAEEKATKNGWWAPKPAVARVVVIGFVVGTGFHPMLWPIVRSGVAQKSMEETVALIRFVEDNGRFVTGRLGEIFQ